jgi:hypothetical protein
LQKGSEIVVLRYYGTQPELVVFFLFQQFRFLNR